jgi:hypothetical protein
MPCPIIVALKRYTEKTQIEIEIQMYFEIEILY